MCDTLLILLRIYCDSYNDDEHTDTHTGICAIFLADLYFCIFLLNKKK